MTPTERKFQDRDGVEWIVREIVSPQMPPALAKLLHRERRLPGWLTFTASTGERRRLSPYPEDWATVSDFELDGWCRRGKSVPPGPARRKQDQ